nr:selenide, water dikinase SelD [Bacteroidota bacterium]
MKIDLLNLVEQGGCSSKLAAGELQKALAELPRVKHPNLLVDIDTHDDGGVYKINDEQALIQTTDFFPPVCSDPYDFGQIAAANALSDVYAMGGQVLTAMNIVLFPAGMDLSILKEILLGGHDKVVESGGVMVGGHTITGDIPVFGLAVTGLVHPDKIVTNDQARPGDILILTKPIGTGVVIAAWKNKLISEKVYRIAVNTMKQLNRRGAEVMEKFGIKCATDITGFGLAGHALKMAEGSSVSLQIDARKIPVINQVMELIDMGVIPGASFRNQEFAEAFCEFESGVDYNHKMLLFDAQTSGGLLMCVPVEKSDQVISDLKDSGYPQSTIVGKVCQKKEKSVLII